MKAFKKLLISLVILLLLSLFFLTLSYIEKLNTAEITRHELSALESLDFFTATDTDERLAQLRTNDNIKSWVHLAQLHAHKSPNAAYQLGQYLLSTGNKRSAILWFKTAIRQQHIDARLALANIYFDTQQYLAIKPLLLPVITNEKALLALYKLALYQGDLLFINSYKNKLAHGANAEFYQELVQYSVFEDLNEFGLNNKTISKNTSPAPTCLVDVQLFSTNLTGLRHAGSLISSYGEHRMSKYICLTQAKYIPSQAVKCQHEVTEKITCDASLWLTRKDITARYIGLIVEQGKANVDHGIMYLDQNDDLDVLIHELSHFIGFVDEYPLPKQHQKCQQVQETPFAHNLVVLDKNYQGNRQALRENILSQVPWRSLIKGTTPILSQGKNGWRLATPDTFNGEVGMYSADACLHNRYVQAYKPIARRTKLEYFELALPEIYEGLLMLAPREFLMPSYHYNISQDLVEQGELSGAIEVLQSTLFD